MENEIKYSKNIEKYLAFTFIMAVLLIITLIGCGITFRQNTEDNLIATIVAIILFLLVGSVGKKLLNIKRYDIPQLFPNGWEWSVCILLFALVLFLQHTLALPTTLLSNVPLSILSLLVALPYFRIFRKLHREHLS